MRRGLAWVLSGVLAMAVVSVPQAAWASSEVDALLDKLVEKGILSKMDAGDIRREMTAGKEDRNKQLAKEIIPESARNWKWSGDIRLRQEHRNRTGTGQDANRTRIRFRYGVEAKVSDELKVGARLATGSTTDPISTNQTFNTSFNHKTIVLDRAFVAYAPNIPQLTEFNVTGGIIANPFWTVGQLVWDDDLNFDGGAIHLAKTIGPVTLFTNNGLFSLQTDVTESAALWSTQGGAIIKPFATSDDEALKKLKLTGALAYHDYQNVTRAHGKNTALTTAGGTKGNSTDLRDLNLLNTTLELASQYRDVPLGVFGDWIHNTSATSGANGFQLGVRAGKARIPFDLMKGWEGGYYYERIAPDATFGAFTDSDFGNGGANHAGHVYWIKLATLKNSTVQLKYFNTHEDRGTKNHADTFQADWVTSF